jgi:uncharacterized integral membrane protein
MIMWLFGKRETTPAENKTDGEAASEPTESPTPLESLPTGGRTAAAWTAVVVAVILGIALVVFMAQNTRQVEVSFLFFSGSIPVAVALLAAAVLGASVVLVVGTARVTKLRLVARQLGKRDIDRKA